jgi:predicted DNA binding protein
MSTYSYTLSENNRRKVDIVVFLRRRVVIHKLLDDINRVNDDVKYLTLSNQKRRYLNYYLSIYCHNTQNTPIDL